MKNIIAIILCVFCLSFSVNGQKYSTKTGQLIFEASVASFEEVKATNDNVSAILNTETGDFASLALVKGFRFKVALMEEHFNENYAESSKFPKAVFRGKLVNFDASQLSEEEQTYTASGIINMHGVDKVIETQLVLKKVDGTIYLTTNFILKPADFNIEIPSVVSSKIAEEINVNGTYKLKTK